MKFIKLFIKNLKFLFNKDLEKMQKTTISYQDIVEMDNRIGVKNYTGQ